MLSILKNYHLNPTKTDCQGNIYKIDSKHKSYALKKVAIEPGRLEFFLSAMDYLWQRGFFFMSQLIKTRTGELYVKSGTDLFFMTEWIEGRYINFSQREELNCALEMLAKMHQLGEGFLPPENSIIRNDIGRWPIKWKQRIADLELMDRISQEQKDCFDITFQKTAGVSIEESYQALEALESVNYREYCQAQQHIRPLCHRDFVYHNVIYTGGKSFIIDFEYCVQDSRVTDLARFIRKSWTEHPWEGETVRKIISGYQKNYPLSATELRLLQAVLMFPHDVWRCGHKWYFSGQRKKSVYNLLLEQYQYHNQKYDILAKLEQKFILP